MSVYKTIGPLVYFPFCRFFATSKGRRTNFNINKIQFEPFFYLCSTVSSMLSGLETGSLGHKAQGSLHPRHSLSKSYVRQRLPGFKQGINVNCLRPLQTVTRPSIEAGTLWSVVRDDNHCSRPPHFSIELKSQKTKFWNIICLLSVHIKPELYFTLQNGNIHVSHQVLLLGII